MNAWFRQQLDRYPRIAIAGGPRTGKTTMSGSVIDRHVLHTDFYKDYPWEDVPELVLNELRDMPRFLVEGVQVPRCLRKGLKVDAVLWLDQPYGQLTPGQRTMTKAVRTVFLQFCATNELVPVLQPAFDLHV